MCDVNSLKTIARSHYADPPRAYHNWSHVEAMLAELEAVRDLCVDPETVEWAIWFHDAVYDARAKDNEEKSAELARRELSRAGVSAVRVDVVCELILDTKHAREPAARDGAVMVDLDLSILGKSWDEFEKYDRAIREEYAFVAEEDFARGRCAVLEGFLKRGRIFRTRYFFEKYESAARGNVGRAILKWEGARG